jgi:hypothetical protein
VLFAGGGGAHAVAPTPIAPLMAKDNPRARRLGEQIQRELTELLRRDVKDERIGNVTITAVDVTGDLRTRACHYLVFGKEGPDAQVQAGLDERRRFSAQCAVESPDDSLHAHLELRARHLDRARRAPDAADRFGDQVRQA